MANNKKKAPPSLQSTLMIWLMVLTLLPSSIIAGITLYNANNQALETAQERLGNQSVSRSHFVHSWFDGRVSDMKHQANSPMNQVVIQSLDANWKSSHLSIKDYLRSPQYDSIVKLTSGHLKQFFAESPFVQNIFMANPEGNVLYSFEEEGLLGKNLTQLDTPHLQTLKQAMQGQLSSENDYSLVFPLEEKPKNRKLSAYLIGNIQNDSGFLILKINLQRILENFQSENPALKNFFLTNKDGLLLTPYKGDWKSVYTKVIDLHASEAKGYDSLYDWALSWFNQQNHHHIEHAQSNEARLYEDADHNTVLGSHHGITVAGTQLYFFSEFDAEKALETGRFLGWTLLVLLIGSGIIGFILASIISRRITAPIAELVEISMKAAAGLSEERAHEAKHKEINDLSLSFNHFLDAKQDNELAIAKTNDRLQDTVYEIQAIIEAVDNGILVADTQGNIIRTNEAYNELWQIPDSLTHCTQESDLLDHAKTLVEAPDAFVSGIKELYANVEVAAKELVHFKDGTVLERTTNPLQLKNGGLARIWSFRDITAKERANKALLEAKQAAEDAVQTKGEFLASMSHEIRTPMNGVLGMLGLVLNTELSHDQRHQVEVAQNSARSLLTLINDILDFSKVEAGKLELEMLDFNLRSMLGEFVSAQVFQASEKGLELVLDTTEVDGINVQGDPGRLRQILTNITGNAIKFTQEGEIVIRSRLEEHNQDTWKLTCSISDTGIGIPADKIDRLFESFTQVDASTTREFGGTGLGLTIVKHLCELMGGGIKVTSEHGQGSCFEFHVLLSKSTAKREAIPDVDFNKLHILVVDDNRTNREVVRGQLEQWGAQVTDVASGAEALTTCQEALTNQSLFDIGIIDMQMPEMNGAELGEALQANPDLANIKMVMMTSIGGEGDEALFEKIGFNAYFPKPATASDLFDAIAVVSNDEAGSGRMVTHNYLSTMMKRDEQKATSRVKWPDNTRLLLVEDNQINQMVARGILDKQKLLVDVAGNGLEAISSLNSAPASSPYTLVLMDCQMPEMDGYEATQAIRSGRAGERYQDMPIIAMTANAMMGDREKCLEAGMTDYLTKPIDPNILVSKLIDYLIKGVKAPDNSVEDVLNNEAAQAIEAPSTSENLSDDHVWNLDDMKSRVGDDPDMIKMLLNVFLQEYPDLLEKLKEAVTTENAPDIKLHAHSLKGMASNLGAIALQETALELEQAGEHNQLEGIAELFAKVETEGVAFSNAVNGWMAAN